MNSFVAEFKRYRFLLEKAVEQISEQDFFQQDEKQGNSIAILVNHLAGNFQSRFTDFLTTDGEKPWRNRDGEFEVTELTQAQIMERWTKAWQVLQNAVFSLNPKDMHKTITIRGVTFSVEEALLRSLAHFSYHVGQIVFLAKKFSGKNWHYLSIPPGASQSYNQNPTKEKGFEEPSL